MEFMNVVRMQIKPGRFDEWTALIETHMERYREIDGLISARYIRTGQSGVCGVGLWRSEDAIAAARPLLIELLDEMRPLLEGGDTDPVSGEVIVGGDF